MERPQVVQVWWDMPVIQELWRLRLGYQAV
jgi:hypothetical protein